MTLDEAKEQLNITVDLLPASNSNRPGTRLNPEYITIHNTGNSNRGADARAHARYMKGEDAQRREVSWHFTVDDAAVFQSLPEREVGWHAGRGNSRSIGVEICENQGIDQAEANRRAALLTALLLKQAGIEPNGHVVQHHHWTGKDCPRVLRRGSWEGFLEMVRKFHRQLDGTAREECALCIGEEDGADAREAEALEGFAHEDGHGSSNPDRKPTVDESIQSPYRSARNGDISGIVLHFTDGGTLESVVEWFHDNPRQVSAHYVIGRDGRIAQMVPDSERANHCAGANRHTVGIEHVARGGQRMTTDQELSSIALVRWLHRQYEIPLRNITGHRFTPAYTGGTGGTDCPHSLFGDRTEEAIQGWVQRNIAPETPPEGLEAGEIFTPEPEDENGGGGGGRPFSTEPARSGNEDGSSETTGLRGTISEPGGGVEIVDAVERLHAVREGRDLGRKEVRQVRTKRNGETLVEQADYCWQARALPAARLIEDFDGFGSEDGIIRGRATYFGKYDREDEGTGTPLFRTVQTNSSVFAMALPRAVLLRYGFAREVGGVLRPTERGLTAVINVYCPATRRLARLPLGDVGPGAGTGAVADLSAAAVAWLLRREERDANHYGLPNPQVHLRIS